MCLVCVTQNAVTVAWPQLELLTSLISHEYTGWISHLTFVATFHMYTYTCVCKSFTVVICVRTFINMCICTMYIYFLN